LSRLVDAKFLARTREGAFVQLDRTQRVSARDTADLFARL
jgi:hypothetical protein